MSALNKLLLKERQQAYAVAHPPTIKDARQLSSDWRYLAALDQLQLGAWRQAGSLLRRLQTEYPATPLLAQLLAEAQVKAEIETVWAGKIIGRQPRRFPRRLVSLLAYLLVVACLLLGGSFLYQKMQTVDGQTAQEQVLLAQAQAAMNADQVDSAADLFRQLLVLNPGHLLAQRGYANAALQLEVAGEYAAGVQALQAHDFAQALTHLTTVQQQAPNYRDVERLLTQVQSAQTFAQLFAAAETAYQAQAWPAAVQAYAALRQLDSTYAAEIVTPHLAAAYLRGGQQIVAQRPDQGADLSLAEEYFYQATRLAVDATPAQQEQARLAAYLSGARALQQADPDAAVAALALVYAATPGYLGGYLAEQLYAAYLMLGDRARAAADLPGALAWYNKAAALPVPDNSAALQQAQALTVTPTVTPVAQVEAEVPVYAAAPPPTATPVPAPSSLAAFQGWIAFRTNRDGDVTIYVMQPDGSQQQRAPDDAAATLDPLYAQQQWSADGTTLLYVANAPNRADSNLFTVRADLPITATRDVMLTDFNGSEYDPVWSPTGTTIAFVANHTGNDELWTMNVAGGAPVQLTTNQWEWDKHPTWSPDGTQLAFFSNRQGLRQIWVMNVDGTNQYNISNNSIEDWDPVWIR